MLDLEGQIGGPPVDPRLRVVLPLLLVRDEEHARARDRGGRGVEQVADLEEQLHVAEQPDALVGGEGEQPVVVHHGVHVLDPVGVEVAVEDDPLRVGVGRIGHVAHRARHQPVLPLARRQVDVAVQLVGRNGLRVDVLPDGLAHHAALLVLLLDHHQNRVFQGGFTDGHGAGQGMQYPDLDRVSGHHGTAVGNGCRRDNAGSQFLHGL